MNSFWRTHFVVERKPLHWRLVLRLLLSLLLLGSLPSQVARLADASPANLLPWTQVNADGMGSADHDTAWSMVAFQNQLYTGIRTPLSGARIWRWVADTTVWVNYAPPSWLSNNYNKSIPSMITNWDGKLVVGTENPNFGAGVWLFDGTNWTQINTDGFGTASNSIVWTLHLWTGSYIVAGTGNPTGTRVYWYQVGTTWNQINTDGFGDANNTTATSMAETYDQNLVVGTMNYATGAEVWKGVPGTWSQINSNGFGDPHNVIARSMAVFNGWLYVGTVNGADGAEIWRNNQDDHDWQRVAVGGLNDKNNVGVSSLYAFAGYLYAGTENTANGAQIWRTADGLSWDKVMDGGFGDIHNGEVPSLMGFGHQLFAGTRNFNSGAEVWRSLPLGENPAFQVSDGSGYASYSNAAFNSTTGEYLVAWVNRRPVYDIFNENVEVRRVSNDGQLPYPRTIIASEPTENLYFYSDLQIAYDSNNDRYLAAWKYHNYGNGYNDLQVQLISVTGTKIGSPITLKSVDPGLSILGLQRMVFSPVTNDYLLLYALHDPDGTGFRLDAMTIDNTGQLLADNISVRGFDQIENLRGADLAWNHAHNECLAVWGETSSGAAKVYARRIELATPAVLGDIFMVSTNRDNYDDNYPGVAAVGAVPQGTGTYLVTWRSNDLYQAPKDRSHYIVVGRKVDGDGNFMGETFPVSTLTNLQGAPRNAGSDDARVFFTAYLTDYNFPGDFPWYHGRFLTNAGNQVGEQRWLGGGELYYIGLDFALPVAGSGGQFLIVKSYRAPSAEYNQVWATLIPYELEQPPINVTISGVNEGVLGQVTYFTATVEPISTTLPITYTWDADDQSPIKHPGGELTDKIDWAWEMPGLYTITVTASNLAGQVSDNHIITITKPINKSYLPLIINSAVTPLVPNSFRPEGEIQGGLIIISIVGSGKRRS